MNREEDAQCIVDALVSYSATLRHTEGGAWNVHVDISSASLGDLLAALHKCLEENDIRFATMMLDERTYAIEATLDPD
jgi:hypothetical protein